MKRKVLPVEYSAMDDHSLLVALCISHDELKEKVENHLEHSWKILCLAVGAILTGSASLFVGLLLLIVKFRVG